MERQQRDEMTVPEADTTLPHSAADHSQPDGESW